MRRLSFSVVIFCSLLVLVAAVISWQLSIARGAPIQLSESESMNAARGICREDTERFFYFYYYLNLLPVTSTLGQEQFSLQAAQEFVKGHGTSLSNDLNTGCAVGRVGDWGKFFLYFPHAWLTQTAYKPSVILATTLIFMIALVGILIATFRHRRIVFGIALVLFVGSYKIQLFWSYFANNVHGILASTVLILIAINFRFLTRWRVQPSNVDWILAVSSAVVLGFARSIRGDALPMACSVVLVYLLSGQRWSRRFALSTLFVGSLLTVTASFNMYFDFKSKQSRAFISSAGGTIYQGEASQHHPVWHSVAAGLGDFGMDRGFAWDDDTIYRMALPTVNRKMGRNFHVNKYFLVDPATPPEQWLKPEIVPEYDETVRDLVLSAIRANPRWYFNILVKRTIVLLKNMNRIRIGWGSFEVFLPFSPWLLIILGFLTGMLGRAEYLKIVLFVIPTAFVPIFMYSGHGTVFLAMIHLVAGAVLVEAIALAVVGLLKILPICRAKNLASF